MKWNPFYADDPKLNKVRPEPGTSVLVTCLDKRGARKVVQAHCSDDAAQPFSTRSPVIAWAPMPEPYSGCRTFARAFIPGSESRNSERSKDSPGGVCRKREAKTARYADGRLQRGYIPARFPRTYPHRPDRKETGLTKTVYQRMDHILARKQEFSSFSS